MRTITRKSFRGEGAVIAVFVVSSCAVAARVGLPGAPAAPTPPRAAPVAAPATVAKVAPTPAAAVATPPPAVPHLPPAEKKKLDLRAHSANARIKRTSGAYEVDDVVLAHRWALGLNGDKKYFAKEWTPGTIIKVDGDTISLKYFNDDETQELSAKSLKAFDWKPDTKVGCAGGPRPTGRVIEAPAGEEVRVAYRDPDQEKTMPIVSCFEAPHWYDTLHETFRNHAQYGRLKAPPKSVSADPPSSQVAGALADSLAQADGGGYLKVQKCYVTSSAWMSLSVGSRHTGRRANAECVVGVPAREDARTLEACLVMSGACEQKYLGGARYGGCRWEGSAADYKTVDCALVK